jgi:hypothetical protein
LLGALAAAIGSLPTLVIAESPRPVAGRRMLVTVPIDRGARGLIFAQKESGGLAAIAVQAMPALTAIVAAVNRAPGLRGAADIGAHPAPARNVAGRKGSVDSSPRCGAGSRAFRMDER